MGLESNKTATTLITHYFTANWEQYIFFAFLLKNSFRLAGNKDFFFEYPVNKQK